jgi:hypothetical protein
MGSSTSHDPIGIHGLLGGQLHFLLYFYCDGPKSADAVTFVYKEELQFPQVSFVFLPLKLFAIAVKVLAVFSANCRSEFWYTMSA